jgi:hypothetical protein
VHQVGFSLHDSLIQSVIRIGRFLIKDSPGDRLHGVMYIMVMYIMCLPAL